MARRSKSDRYERWTRAVTVSSFRARVPAWANEERGREPEIEVRCSLHLVGVLDEEIRSTREIEIYVRPEDKVTAGPARPASVGVMIGFRPCVQVVVSFNHREFDRVWYLALTGHLKFVHLVFTKPHYSRALVTNVSFSTEAEE